TDLFDADTIDRMLGHYQRVLEAVTEDASQGLDHLPLLNEIEKRQLVVEWNETQADYPTQSCIHHLIAAQARRCPHAIAVVAADSRLSYAELDRRANRLAHFLRRSGVGPETAVGICLQRSCDLIVALLAV